MAEQHTATAAFSVTLTYSGDVPEAALLRYSDVQKFLKRLRSDGFAVRYLCCGEYGTKKGRAHWHIALFFDGEPPQVETDVRIAWEYWPHGLCYFQRPDYAGFRYAMKYALKQEGNAASSRAFSLSKKPPLGAKFFAEFAEDLARQRLAIHSPEYAFAHARNADGKLRRFWIQNKSRDLFVEAYFRAWKALHRDTPPPSPWLWQNYDYLWADTWEHFGPWHPHPQTLPGWQPLPPLVEVPAAEPEPAYLPGVLLLRYGSGRAIIDLDGDGVLSIHWGGASSWEGKLSDVESVEQLLRRLGLPKSVQSHASTWCASRLR